MSTATKKMPDMTLRRAQRLLLKGHADGFDIALVVARSVFLPHLEAGTNAALLNTPNGALVPTPLPLFFYVASARVWKTRFSCAPAPDYARLADYRR